MVPYSLPLEDLTDVKLLLFHDDIGRTSDLNILVHIDVKWDSRLTPNEPNQDVGTQWKRWTHAPMHRALRVIQECLETHQNMSEYLKMHQKHLTHLVEVLKHAQRR